ncbi:hypothetical protein SAMN04489729_4237 [Amycolatopsis lurida]|uniref:Uncharacterized protein n=1 Tax=Amycolatopsis lurida NRRL 2430 TaxID=1460371 RepID=A0A2P2G1T9_AMYLU|nr:hypothetical protein [Amycolatopsis lurida]KFU82931.1 hypothetical protein BB31_00120 [Amycolatopsis lurida NRRL 2430]SED39887.1 hypothetical protein SAMN04489729_4237 [Amycolatopsis lurida]
MTRTVSTEIAARFRDLADTLARNAAVLSSAGLPEVVTSVRATVYGDVAAQLRTLAEDEMAQAAGNPLVVPAAESEIASGVARRFEQLAGLLAANARLLVRRTTEAGLLARAGVYRDVAAQVRILAEEHAHQATIRPERETRPPLSNLTPLSPVVVRAATRAPKVRPAFLEQLVAAIAKRRAQGWSVARLTRWLRESLRDPQTDHVHPCAQRSFVAYVTGLLTTPAATVRAA